MSSSFPSGYNLTIYNVYHNIIIIMPTVPPAYDTVWLYVHCTYKKRLNYITLFISPYNLPGSCNIQTSYYSSDHYCYIFFFLFGGIFDNHLSIPISFCLTFGSIKLTSTVLFLVFLDMPHLFKRNLIFRKAISSPLGLFNSALPPAL